MHEAARCGHAAVLALLLGPQNKRDAQHTKTALVNAADRVRLVRCGWGQLQALGGSGSQCTPQMCVHVTAVRVHSS